MLARKQRKSKETQSSAKNLQEVTIKHDEPSVFETNRSSFGESTEYAAQRKI